MNTKSRMFAATMVTAGLLLSPWSVIAQQAPAAPAAPDQTVTRAYDVRDLLLTEQDYPLSGGLVPPTRVGGMESDQVAAQAKADAEKVNWANAMQAWQATAVNQRSSIPPTPPTVADELQRLITEEVDSSSWKDNGGSVGSIAFLNGQMFVTQTSENQNRVQEILAEVRKGNATMVCVRADWILLSPGQLGSIQKNGGGDTSPLPEINRDALEKMAASALRGSGQIACFSGQTVHLASGLVKTAVTGVTPVVAPQAIAYQPTTENIQYGLSLQVMPAIGSDSATLDLLSVASDPPTGDNNPTTQPIALDRMNSLVQHFHTTVQVPLNKPVLVGGMTLDPSTAQASGQQLYLIVEADAASPK